MKLNKFALLASLFVCTSQIQSNHCLENPPSPSESIERSVYVYPLNYVSAKHFAPILQNLTVSFPGIKVIADETWNTKYPVNQLIISASHDEWPTIKNIIDNMDQE